MAEDIGEGAKMVREKATELGDIVVDKLKKGDQVIIIGKKNDVEKVVKRFAAI